VRFGEVRGEIVREKSLAMGGLSGVGSGIDPRRALADGKGERPTGVMDTPKVLEGEAKVKTGGSAQGANRSGSVSARQRHGC